MKKADDRIDELFADLECLWREASPTERALVMDEAKALQAAVEVELRRRGN